LELRSPDRPRQRPEGGHCPILPSDIGFVEDVNDVFDIFLVGYALGHLEVVEKEGRDICADREDFDFFVFFDEVPVVFSPSQRR